MGAGFREAGMARSRCLSPRSPRGRSVSRSATHSRRPGSGWMGYGWEEISAKQRHRSLGSAALLHPRRYRPRGLVHLLGSQSPTSSTATTEPTRWVLRERENDAGSPAPGRGDHPAGLGLAIALSLRSVGGMAGAGWGCGIRGGDQSARPARREAPISLPAGTGWRIASEATSSLPEWRKLLPSHPS